MVHVFARFLHVDGLLIALRGDMQSTSVIFGAVDIVKFGSGGESRHPTARTAGAELFSKSAPAKCPPREEEVRTV